MRAAVIHAVAIVVLAFPQNGNAQVFRFETPAPTVTAASAPWQLNGEPIFHAGHFYYPTGPDVFFDGRVMVRTDTYFGVPLYEDSTIEPYSIAFVPIGGNRMRPYERRRDGELAGTTGSRAPSFVVEPGPDRFGVTGTAGYLAPASDQSRHEDDTFVATGIVSVLAAEPAAAGALSRSGLWIDFDGARWYSAGRAVVYDPTRFERAGEYRGFPVFSERGAPAGRIFVTTVSDGPLAPFDRR